MVDSIPISYKKQPLTHTAMGTVDNPKRCISKFTSDPNSCSSWSSKNDSSSLSGFTNQWDVLSFPTHYGKKRKPAYVKKPNFGQSYSTSAGANYSSDLFDNLSKVEIVRTCQTLGVGPGGFYQPAYKDGAKLDLQMMCLGLNWDPKRLTYEFIRSVDGCEVPTIPRALRFQVRDAMICGRISFEKEGEGILPFIIPNVCVVNFYSAATGRLDLHQQNSCMGDERDVYKADRVILESGDVLIFGGVSRHIYHGVSSIIPNTAPKKLLEETRLCPGRLNLTFREA
ncbi:hypothetical protein FNV43_RR07869 [Rhamnella rubrinervis]|uniref:Alpha-ketoglutarate-dependent dioxygenase AlkB-like domain-containing protein n=1 Tax=Rhamnella rubrinervis TaxID=2594499 RepID=A0A8K0HGP7_9ROSA|nr:hypothetical protein FNV43_RR07869 [Rhamnella rubrinervis]